MLQCRVCLGPVVCTGPLCSLFGQQPMCLLQHLPDRKIVGTLLLAQAALQTCIGLNGQFSVFRCGPASLIVSLRETV